MGNVNLSGQEAIEKLKTLVKQIDIAMLCTQAPTRSNMHAVPMSTQEVDEDGKLWFIFSSESASYQHLQDNKQVMLLYSDPSKHSYVSVNGIASISRDQSRIDKYWNVMMEGWFGNDKTDDRIRLLSVDVSEAHYWDTDANMFVTFFKSLLNAVTDGKKDVGRSGDLNI